MKTYSQISGCWWTGVMGTQNIHKHSIFLAKLCVHLHLCISLKSQNHTERCSILKKGKKVTQWKKIQCVFIMIVNWRIFFYNGSIEYWRLTHCPVDDVALILRV